ncbi:MAG: hypothetical protein P4L98_11540 [Ancalomicrobiaceae bacterium]|nr:hypothetical protein [Ancalomicrobiaceae bacterium]
MPRAFERVPIVAQLPRLEKEANDAENRIYDPSGVNPGDDRRSQLLEGNPEISMSYMNTLDCLPLGRE